MWVIESTAHVNYAYGKINGNGSWDWMYNPNHATKFELHSEARRIADHYGHDLNVKIILLDEAQKKRPAYFPSCS